MTVAASPLHDDVLSVLTDVWSSFVGADEPLQPAAGPMTHDLELVCAAITITGAWDGLVVFQVTVPAAARITARMLATAEHPTDADLVDAVGELVNMLGGNVKSLLPGPSGLSLPTVLRGRLTSITIPDSVEVCRADLVWGGEPLSLTVHAALGSRTR